MVQRNILETALGSDEPFDPPLAARLLLRAQCKAAYQRAEEVCLETTEVQAAAEVSAFYAGYEDHDDGRRGYVYRKFYDDYAPRDPRSYEECKTEADREAEAALYGRDEAAANAEATPVPRRPGAPKLPPTSRRTPRPARVSTRIIAGLTKSATKRTAGRPPGRRPPRPARRRRRVRPERASSPGSETSSAVSSRSMVA